MSVALDARLVGFARALRGHGVVVGTSEVVDAGTVAHVLGLDDRDRLREGLASALLRRAGQRQVFDDLYDVWFPAAVGDRADGHVEAPPATLTDRRARAEQLREELSRTLAAGDQRALDELAARVVAELGALANAATTGAYSAQQALDTLAPQTAIASALARLQDAAEDAPSGSGDGSGGSGGSGTGVSGPAGGAGFAARFTRDELRSGVTAFRRRVEAETRRRNAEARGAERISRYAVRPPADQTPFLLAGPHELDELRAAVAPLSRKLATRLAARRRRASQGSIDVRRTLRRSLSTGGIPIRPALQHAKPHRPDLVILCDLSTSVSGFSRFTILLVQALAGQFRRVRILGFVNRVDDLTDRVLGAPPGSDLSGAFDDLSRMTRWHRNSDYGAVLADVVEHHLDTIGHRTAVLVLGDARSNHTDPQLDMLREIAARARHVSWLNPEPARMWGSGDSVALRYSEIVDMHECRNLAQLREFVARLLPV
ncbi:VWA domain-containing protein [Knoellia sp. CPCC 206435]|uniref:VWA domain-containing protein n=1 Tax=Knoellia terrae TaxID=3404797 RepID=UPI003B438415